MRNQARYAFGVVAVLAAGSVGFVTAQGEGPHRYSRTGSATGHSGTSPS